jgi:hypothetical protein
MNGVLLAEEGRFISVGVVFLTLLLFIELLLRLFVLSHLFFKDIKVLE